MNHYIAHIIYRIKCTGSDVQQQEEQWRLITAADEEQAISEAVRLAKSEETSFVDRHGRCISWQFLAVKTVQYTDLSHGAVLFSSIREDVPVALPVWTE